ncbi:MAG: pimeloyl-ACP methyl ester carboxylesterase [Flammeovirgaceae bacterium]|jgi:pimeloyl-ACP methyl ester carboxylesterase
MKNVFALMIGIDNYPIERHRLRGCVNDMLAMKSYLEGRFDANNFKLNIKALKDEEATRDNIIDGFQTHLTQAKEGDIVFIHYSGHGSQIPAPKEFWHSEPDKMMETMVCYDSRTAGGFDLTSKELGYLIWQVSQSNPHIVVLFDCCHSGSGTRETDSKIRSRMAEQGNKELPFKNFVGFKDYQVDEASGKIIVPVGKHILLAASRDNETAKETNVSKLSPISEDECKENDKEKLGQGGVFTHSLLKVLRESKGNLSYQDLMTRTQTLVYNTVNEQHPQLEANGSGDEKDKLVSFLDGAILPKADYFTVQHDAKEGWIMKAGGLHGIPFPTNNSTTKLAIFDESATVSDLANIEKAVGTASVLDVSAKQSTVKLEGVSESDSGKIYKAKITEIPVKPVEIQLNLEGDSEGIAFAKSALETLDFPYLSVTESSDKAKYQILAKGNQYYVVNVGDDKPLFKRIDGYSKESAEDLVEKLMHVATWESGYVLSNPDTEIDQSEIGVELTEVTEVSRRGFVAQENALDASQVVTLEYKFDAQSKKWNAPKFRLKLKNNGQETLYFGLLFFSYDFGINTTLLQVQRLEPGQEVFATRKNSKGKVFDYIPAIVRSEYTSWGITDASIMLKLLVSNVEFSTTSYALDSLELDRKEQKGRDYFDEYDDDLSENYADWTVKDIHITTIRPLESMDLAEDEVKMQKITIKPHSGLKAKVNLASQKEATRAVGKEAHKSSPTALAGNSSFEPMALNDAMGNSAPLSILELSDVQDTSIVNEADPLQMAISADLADNEMILPIGFDEATGCFIPLGTSSQSENGEIQIHIDQLPEPTPAGTRSLGGSIKIFFQKVVLEKIGIKTEYPLLQEGIVSEDGEELEYNKDKENIKAKVAKAKAVVVFVHGIIGDTKDMTKSMRKGVMKLEDGSEFRLSDKYDLALTFDYENLNTQIQETARLFKQRLEAVGLGEGHGKTLHIVAHSMGGLVSRWMIEKEGGDKMVQHLIQLGTPNGGSAWSDVYNWSKVAIGFVMGKVSIASVYLAPLSFLLKKASDNLFITLGQMNAKSDFYKDLNGSSYDPKIPYTIICGNTSKIPRMQDEEVQSMMKKIIAGIGNKAESVILNDLIFRTENDIAVALESIKAVSEMREFPPVKIEVACDHMSYFVTDAGLDALVKTVYEA